MITMFYNYFLKRIIKTYNTAYGVWRMTCITKPVLHMAYESVCMWYSVWHMACGCMAYGSVIYYDLYYYQYYMTYII
jgi:hypothetical protein